MPELPLSMRKLRRSSKSFTSPPRQMRKVLPGAGVTLVVSPRTTPSLNDQSCGWPSQPVRSFPLNSLTMPSGSGGAGVVAFADLAPAACSASGLSAPMRGEATRARRVRAMRDGTILRMDSSWRWVRDVAECNTAGEAAELEIGDCELKIAEVQFAISNI